MTLLGRLVVESEMKPEELDDVEASAAAARAAAVVAADAVATAFVFEAWRYNNGVILDFVCLSSVHWRFCKIVVE